MNDNEDEMTMNRYDPILFDTDPQDETREWQPGIITEAIEHIAPGLLEALDEIRKS